MGLFSQKNPEAKIWDGNVIPDPAFQYKKNNVSYYIFFLDDHPNKEEILKSRISAVEYNKKMYKMIIEKEAYELAPDYYSEPVLAADFNYYMGVSRDIRIYMMFVSILIAIVTYGVCGFVLKLNALTTILVTSGVSILYMFLFMNVFVNKLINKHRTVRENVLKSLFGEARLEQMYKDQETYVNKRKAQIEKNRQNDNNSLDNKEEELNNKIDNNQNTDSNVDDTVSNDEVIASDAKEEFVSEVVESEVIEEDENTDDVEVAEVTEIAEENKNI